MKMDSAQRVAQFIGYLRDPNATVRQVAARWLGRWGGSQAVVPLLERLADVSSHVRWEAIRALARVGDGRALPALRALTRVWNDEPDFVREAAVEAVERITARMEAVSGRELAPVPPPPVAPPRTGSPARELAPVLPPPQQPVAGESRALALAGEEKGGEEA
jgi:HEAT repeat protein